VALSNNPVWQVTQALRIADDRHLAPRRSARRSSTTSSTAPPRTSSSQPVSSSGCYVAAPQLVMKSGPLALITSGAAISVARRNLDGWHCVISRLDL
jgi:hypothetical protein